MRTTAFPPHSAMRETAGSLRATSASTGSPPVPSIRPAASFRARTRTVRPCARAKRDTEQATAEVPWPGPGRLEREPMTGARRPMVRAAAHATASPAGRPRMQAIAEATWGARARSRTRAVRVVGRAWVPAPATRAQTLRRCAARPAFPAKGRKAVRLVARVRGATVPSFKVPAAKVWPARASGVSVTRVPAPHADRAELGRMRGRPAAAGPMAKAVTPRLTPADEARVDRRSVGTVPGNAAARVRGTLPAGPWTMPERRTPRPVDMRPRPADRHAMTAQDRRLSRLPAVGVRTPTVRTPTFWEMASRVRTTWRVAPAWVRPHAPATPSPIAWQTEEVVPLVRTAGAAATFRTISRRFGGRPALLRPRRLARPPRGGRERPATAIVGCHRTHRGRVRDRGLAPATARVDLRAEARCPPRPMVRMLANAIERARVPELKARPNAVGPRVRRVR